MCQRGSMNLAWNSNTAYMCLTTGLSKYNRTVRLAAVIIHGSHMGELESLKVCFVHFVIILDVVPLGLSF